jgi:UTP--glucose-1-phosphate uridylyltransferase
MDCIYMRQPKALGLGHAVLCAQCVVVNEPFAVLLADDLMVGKPPVLKQMVDQFNEWRASILAVQEVPPEHTKRYGIVAGTPVNDRLMDLSHIVEKPAPEDAPSNLGVAGRYILTPGIFHEIANQPRGVGGEIQLTDGIANLMRREKVFAYRTKAALRLRQQGRLPGSQCGTGSGPPAAGRRLPRVPQDARHLSVMSWGWPSVRQPAGAA